MREIKFRAWDKENNRMLYCGFNPLDLMAWPTTGHVLMQFTGLKDKNGKEIYEGDIIVRAWIDMGPAGEQPMIHAVVMDSWGCGLQEWTYKEANHLPEIIGNIYEKPELLKV